MSTQDRSSIIMRVSRSGTRKGPERKDSGTRRGREMNTVAASLDRSGTVSRKGGGMSLGSPYSSPISGRSNRRSMPADSSSDDRCTANPDTDVIVPRNKRFQPHKVPKHKTVDSSDCNLEKIETASSFVIIESPSWPYPFSSYMNKRASLRMAKCDKATLQKARENCIHA
jgi:hypothetical protein